VLEVHGWEAIGPRLTERSKKGDWAGMADEITDEMLEEFAVVTREDDVVDRLKERYTGRLDRLSFYFPGALGDDARRRALVRAFNEA
jgi:hypothetical protein